jgi:phosphoribosylcarboxyaminoimidazole (NCAIR) mutase
MEKRLALVFGSDSDEAKVLPGVQQFTREHPDWQVGVHYASADNTPDKVKLIMGALTMPLEKQKEMLEKMAEEYSPRGWTGMLIYKGIIESIQEMQEPDKRVFISGAGMSNVLTGVVKTYADIGDLVVGIPITDSKTGGLSSLLSTSEKPPLNPVLTVGLDNSYAALNIAHRFLAREANAQPVAVLDHRDGYNIEYEKEEPRDAAKKIMHELSCFGQPAELRQIGKLQKNDIVISPFYNYSDDRVTEIDSLHLRDVDGILAEGNGIQVAVYAGDKLMEGYENCLKGTRATGLVGLGSYKNAAQMAVVLAGNKPALNIIRAVKDAKIEKLRAHRGLLIKNGEVTRI